MNEQLAAAKRVHDAAVELGAHCDAGNCFFNPYSFDSYKSAKPLEQRARALMLLSSLN
jgi:hypothetical protein